MIIHTDNGSGNYSKTLTKYCAHLNIINDALTELVVKASGQVIIVLGMEQFEGDFAPFKTIEIAASGPWRYVLEGNGDDLAGDEYDVASLLSEVRDRVSDVDVITYEDKELIPYLNTTIDYLNWFLINLNKPEMIKEMIIANGTAVPADWVRFVGMYPVYTVQDSFKFYEETEPFVVRYFGLKPHVSTVMDVVPFKAKYRSILVQGTAMHALNTDEYDISQDKGLLKDLLDVIAAGRV